MKRTLFSLLPVFTFLSACLLAQDRAASHSTEAGRGQTSVLYSGDTGFLVSAPDGWVTDPEVGKRLNACCVCYPTGTSWNTALTVMYPNIVTKKPGQSTLQEYMARDLREFRKHDPGLVCVDSDEQVAGDGRVAKIRNYYGVNRGSFEAVAYIEESNFIALLVASSKTEKGLNDSLRDFHALLHSYQFVQMKFVESHKH